MVSVSADKTVRHWDVTLGVCIEVGAARSAFCCTVVVGQVISGHTDVVWCLSIDGELLVTAGADETVHSWRLGRLTVPTLCVCAP